MTNAKAKGNKGERSFVYWLEEEGFFSKRTPHSGGGIKKGDIENNLDFSIEVKTTKNAKLPDWWRQTVRDADLASTRPLLAIHLDGMAKDNWMIVMDNHDWIELMKNEKTPAPILERGKLKYLIPQARNLLRQILKELGDE